ncbi:hypothetical protein ASC96_25745 [Rhizobium sp. Root1204]|nr:hypothetical protein ASC96_25745 [Rhizobium sp. Root1204]
MYGLVMMILANSSVTAAEKRMAQYISRLLNVMELAVASAPALFRARIGFAHLTEMVVEAACSNASGERAVSPR